MEERNGTVKVIVRDRRTYKFSALICRAPESDDHQWIAHCPEIDVISQGNSPAHAVHMIMEAVAMCVLDDLEEQLDPLDRARNEDVAARCERILRTGRRLTSIDEAVQHQELVALVIEWTPSFQRDVLANVPKQDEVDLLYGAPADIAPC